MVATAAEQPGGSTALDLDPSQVFAGAAQSRAVSSAWIAAAKSGNVGMLDSLVERHSTGLLDYRCQAVGNTALHWASAKNHLAALRWLLDRGASLELSNNSGATALHSGAANGASACVDELLGRGAATEQADDTGRTAHDWAQVRAHKDVLAAIRRHTGLPPQHTLGGRTPSPPASPAAVLQPVLSPTRGRVAASSPTATPRRIASRRRATEEPGFVGLDGSPWQPKAAPPSPSSSVSSVSSAGEMRRRELAAKSENRKANRAEEQATAEDFHRIASLEMALGSAAEAARKGMEETERLRAKVASLETQLSEAVTSARTEGDAAREALGDCEARLAAEAKAHTAFRAQVETERQAAVSASREESMEHARKVETLQRAVEQAQEDAATGVAAAESVSQAQLRLQKLPWLQPSSMHSRALKPRSPKQPRLNSVLSKLPPPLRPRRIPRGSSARRPKRRWRPGRQRALIWRRDFWQQKARHRHFGSD